MRHKDPELMNRIKQYISEYYLENAGAMPTITQIAVSVGRFSPFRVGLKTPISVNLKSPMHHVCY